MPRRRHPLARALLRIAACLPLTRGRWALLRGDSGGAVRALERALACAPDSFDVLLHLARAYLRARDLPRARRALARAREVSPRRFEREAGGWVTREGFDPSSLTDAQPAPAPRGEVPVAHEAAVHRTRVRSGGEHPFGDCRDLDEYARFRSMPPITQGERESADWDAIAEDLLDG